MARIPSPRAEWPSEPRSHGKDYELNPEASENQNDQIADIEQIVLRRTPPRASRRSNRVGRRKARFIRIRAWSLEVFFVWRWSRS